MSECVCERDGVTEIRSTLKLTLKLGLLQHLDLPDVDVVQWIDGLTRLLYVLPNAVRDPETHTHTPLNHQNPHTPGSPAPSHYIGAEHTET